MGGPAIFEARIILIMCYHGTEINSIPPTCLSLKNCISSSSVDQRKILEGWFRGIINLYSLITEKDKVFCPIGGVENSSLNRVLWVRWWVDLIMGLWWRRGSLFVKEAFILPLLPDNREPLGTMEGLPWNSHRRE